MSQKISRSKRKLKPLPMPCINYNNDYLDSVDIEIEKNQIKRGWGGLASNLIHTEIDIVIDTGENNVLLIGEAKDKSSMSVTGNHFLPHQLVRQFIAARLLMSMVPYDKIVVPFIVCNNLDSIRVTEQVEFMISQNWLCENRIFEWEDIENILSISRFDNA